MNDSKLKFSFVVPIYHDGYLAEEFVLEFESVFKKWLGEPLIHKLAELIFVFDGGNKDSLDILINLHEKFPFVRIIELSRNFGQHIALSCGYEHAKGDYVGMMNVDMEDPPNQIPLLLDYLVNNNDCDIVYGLRKERKGPFIERMTSKWFQFILNKLTGNDFPLNASTLRIMNRKFVDTYNSLNEKSRYIPGLEMWIGFKQGFVPTDHQIRKKGKSSYNFKRRIAMAFEAIISFSDLPLRWFIGFGFAVAIVGFLLSAVLVVKQFFYEDMQPGYTSTISLIVLFSGLQMTLLGMLGLYIGRILKEVQNRPLYVIRNKYNF